GLQPVADAQQRQAAVEYFLRRSGCVRQGGALRATGQDDALGAECGDLGRIVVPGPDFAVHAELADAARDQLRVLGAEIEDEDLVVVDIGHVASTDAIWKRKTDTKRGTRERLPLCVGLDQPIL